VAGQRADRPDIAFEEEDGWGVGGLTDFSGAQPIFGEECEYDYENWGDAEAGTREPYTTTVYNLEVEDWHTYFVGKTGLWVHNTNCLDDALSVRDSTRSSVRNTVSQLVADAINYQGYKKLTKAELNDFLRSNANA
jgi:Pretoxin HINT domain